MQPTSTLSSNPHALQARVAELERINQMLLEKILPLGIALSAETDFKRLQERIVVEAKAICNADMGLLYLRDGDRLRYAIDRTTSLNIYLGGSERPITYEPLPLPDHPIADPAGQHAAVYVAMTGETVRTPNIYADATFDFSSTKAFDREYDYRSISCLTVPLSNGEVFGVIQLMNPRDRQSGAIIPFDAEHQLLVESVAMQLAVVLHNHLLLRRQTVLARLERELQIGRQLQAGFFPETLPQRPGWAFSAHFESALEVCGDFYDTLALPHGRLGLVIADVCGKGVAAALFMALVRSLIRAYVQRHFYVADRTPTPAALHAPEGLNPPDVLRLIEVVQLTNAYLINNHLNAHIFATLFFAVLDPESGALAYVNCGHNPPLLLHGEQPVQRLAPTGPALGLLPHAVYQVGTAQLDPGDMLLAFTDGITEARSPQGAFFSQPALVQLVEAHYRLGMSAESMLTVIEAAVKAHLAGARITDDLTLLAAQRLAPPS
jgi:sigma-B regulation protein RsbU (phosphoserine phosphatase)